MYNAASSGPNESAIYFDGSPEVTKYSAGSRSWRTNNPGLLPANEITWPYGAIGEALGVAVFQNPRRAAAAGCSRARRSFSPARPTSSSKGCRRRAS